MKCPVTGVYIAVNQNKRLTGNQHIESLKNEIQNLVDVQEARDIEFQEELRKRDSVIGQMVHQQRMFTKQLESLKNAVGKNNHGAKDVGLRLSEPIVNPRRVSQDISDPTLNNDDNESSFYAFYENHILNPKDQDSDSDEEKDSDYANSTKSDSIEKASPIGSQTRDTRCMSVEQEEDEFKIIESQKSKEEIKNIECISDTPKVEPKLDVPDFKTHLPELRPLTQELVTEKLELYELMDSDKYWKKATSKGACDVFVYDGPTSHTGLMGRMEYDYSFETIMRVLADPQNQMDINSFSESHEVLETVNTDTVILYLKFKGMLMVSGRDFVVSQQRVTFSDGTMGYLSFTVDHSGTPEPPSNKVRGVIFVGGWTFRPTDHGTTLVQNYAINDLKGMIPKFAINASASTHVNIFTNLKKLLDKMSKGGELPSKDDLVERFKASPNFMKDYECLSQKHNCE